MARRSLASIAVAIAVALSAGGCGDGGGAPGGSGSGAGASAPAVCTRASCSGQVVVRLEAVPAAAASARVCVDGSCRTVRGSEEELRITLPAQPRSGGPSVRTARVTATAGDATGAPLALGSTAVRLRAMRPNGRGCTPTCWRGETAVRLRSRR